MEPPNSQPPTNQEPHPSGCQSKPTTGKRSMRSQASPDWSLQELLFLVNEVSATESDFMRSLSSHQKWKIISDNCASLGIARTLNQCRRRWELLLQHYTAIKSWQTRTGGSYWALDAAGIAQSGLPLGFDKELFIFVEDNVKLKVNVKDKEKAKEKVNVKDKEKAKEKEKVDMKEKEKEKEKAKEKVDVKEKEKEKAKEELATMDTDNDADLTAALDPGLKKRSIVRPQIKKNEEQEELSAKLREEAEQILAIVNGNSEGNGPRPGETQVEYKRRQADELIKLLGNLTGKIDHLYEMVRGG